MSNAKGKKKLQFPHILTLLILLAVIMGLCTYVIPAGQFEREVVNGRTLIINGSYHTIEQTPVGPFEWFISMCNGFVASAGMLVMLLFFVAAIGMYVETGMISRLMMKLFRVLGKKGEIIIMVIFMLFFSVLGSLGMISPQAAFVPVTMAFCALSGFDLMTSVIMIIFPVFVGFTFSPFNPTSIMIAQDIAELPRLSGLGLRVIMMGVCTAVTIVWVIVFARKWRANPAKSLSGFDFQGKDTLVTGEQDNMTTRDWILFAVFMLSIGLMVYGSINWGFSNLEIGAMFLLSAILCGIIAGYSGEKLWEVFLRETSGMMLPILSIAFARGIKVIMDAGNITDTITYWISLPLMNTSGCVTAVGMYIAQTFINLFVNGASSQAMVTMPIMTPLADLLGVNRQIACSAFQFGDGLSNLIWPTSGAIFAYLPQAKIKFGTYLKATLPFFFVLAGLCCVFLIVATMINYGPF